MAEFGLEEESISNDEISDFEIIEESQSDSELEIINDVTPYQILGVSETDSLSQINAMYRQLALDLHPDKNKTISKDELNILFNAITVAYKEIVKNRRETNAPDYNINYDEIEHIVIPSNNVTKVDDIHTLRTKLHEEIKSKYKNEQNNVFTENTAKTKNIIFNKLTEESSNQYPDLEESFYNSNYEIPDYTCQIQRPETESIVLYELFDNRNSIFNSKNDLNNDSFRQLGQTELPNYSTSLCADIQETYQNYEFLGIANSKKQNKKEDVFHNKTNELNFIDIGNIISQREAEMKTYKFEVPEKAVKDLQRYNDIERIRKRKLDAIQRKVELLENSNKKV